ncbi:hypothetical protein LCGC14_3063840 [marine sediment metagenome]|uniref:HNH nuclease domain-containing protein n=1 Tax=marine sediment metagenome TaxID=412755 RepID=A0A0F8WI24_9ZZZZ
MKQWKRGKPFSPGAIIRILERDNKQCVYCGSPAWMVDHVIPRRDNGPPITSNGVAVCHRCNIRKGARMREKYLVPAILHLMNCKEDVRWMDTHYGDSEAKEKRPGGG